MGLPQFFAPSPQVRESAVEIRCLPWRCRGGTRAPFERAGRRRLLPYATLSADRYAQVGVGRRVLLAGLAEGTGIFVPQAPLLFFPFVLHGGAAVGDFWIFFFNFFFFLLPPHPPPPPERERERGRRDRRSRFSRGRADAAGPGEGGWMSEGVFS